MNKKILIYTSLLLMFFGCSDNIKEKKMENSLKEVGVISASFKEIKITKEILGKVKPYLVAEIRPQSTGIIINKNFNEGSYVKKGDLLFEIDKKQYELDLKQKIAELKVQESLLESITYKKNHYSKLIKNDSVSIIENLTIDNEYKQLLANIELKKIAIENSKLKLSYTDIISPIDGFIGKSDINIGTLVTENQSNSLVTIRNVSKLYIDFTQNSKQLLKNNNSEIEVEIELENGIKLEEKGIIKFIDIFVDENTSSADTRVEINNKEKKLISGSFVNVLFTENIIKNGLTIPNQSILHDNKGNSYIFIRNNGKVEKRNVNPKTLIKNEWLIGNEIKEGEKIIIEGLNKIKEGMEVKLFEVKQ